jgi:hypothetical protein
MRGGLIGLFASLAIGAAAAPAALAHPHGPGCDPSRPAVLHYAGGIPAPG